MKYLTEYLTLILILIGIVLSFFIGNFVIQKYQAYKQWKEDLLIWQNNITNQVIVNKQNIDILVKVYNEYINTKK